MADLKLGELKTLANKQATSTRLTGGTSTSFKDLLIGAGYAVGGAVLPILIAVFRGGSFDVDWTTVGTTAASTLAIYILSKLGGSTQQITTFKKIK